MNSSMTDDEIGALLVDIEKSLRSQIFVGSKVSWLVSLTTAPLIFIPGAGVGLGFGIFSGVMAFVGWLTNHDGRIEWQKVQDNRARYLWREWTQRESLKELGQGFEKTVQMRDDISEIYESNPRGDILPLNQAIRLVNTLDSQQERLDQVANHVEGLRELRTQLLEKSAQLQKLGKKTQSVQSILRQIEEDVNPLETLGRQIEASCHRLELLLISVKKAMQIKQLHNEIDSLTSSICADVTEALEETIATDDLSNIERQITREVETFLRLERETDRHLREI